MTERTKPSEGAGGGLTEALRRYVDALTGFTEVSRDRAERIIGDLAKRGESRARDMQKAARELADRSARNQRELVRLVQKEMRRQIDTRGLATRDEVKRLQERVQQLERQRRSSKAAPKAASKTTAKRSGAKRKPSAPKKSTGS